MPWENIRLAKMQKGAEMKRPFSFGIIMITLLVCPVFFRPVVHAEQSVITLNIGYIPLVAQLPLVVSYDNDRLNFSNVNLSLVKYRSFTSLEAALRVGAIDIADLPLPVAFDMAGDGIDIKIIGGCHSGGSVLERVEYSELSNFRGKIIGVPGLRSNENLDLIQLLSGEKLRYGLDYKTIKVPFNTVLQNLEAGRINAMYFPEPYGSLAEKNRFIMQMEKPEKELSGRLTTVLVARSNILRNNSKKALEEWVQSLARACVFIENDINVLAAKQTAILQESYFGFEQALVSASLVKRRGGIHFSLVMPEKKMLQLHLEKALDLKILLKPVDIDTLVSDYALSGEKGEPPIQ